MRILILGTRGIPNQYGGFEAFAERISIVLTGRGHSVGVMQPCSGKQTLPPVGKVGRIAIPLPKYLPQNLLKVYYDYLSLRKAQALMPDAVIRCGHSASIFYPLFPKWLRERIATNMDGLEWARPKWGVLARIYLMITERMAIRLSGHVVADSQAIAQYIEQKYGSSARYIPYGATPPLPANDATVLSEYGQSRYSYGLCIARIEPENQIELAIKSFIRIRKPLLLVAPTGNAHAQKLIKTYGDNPFIRFCGPIYNHQVLSCLRQNANVYYHGHTAGGTNPSLLDAMAGGCCVVAHSNAFNIEVLGNTGLLFHHQNELERAIERVWSYTEEQRALEGQAAKRLVEGNYCWERVADEYLSLFSHRTMP